jgi:DNA-binding response OmpR family regulator
MFDFALGRKKVLVVDDDVSLQRQIRFHLEHKHENISVFQAMDGHSGIKQALDVGPDLIILDWMLPDINGPEVLSKLKAEDKTKDTPILMLSGRNNIGDIEDMFTLKAERYITKPFSLQNLSDKIIELLS